MRTLLIRNPALLSLEDEEVVAASFGNFDGLHLGHCAVLDELVKQKSELVAAGKYVKSVVLSFYPHPAVVLGKDHQLTLLTTIGQKMQIFSDLGLDYYCLLRFSDDVARMSAVDFIEKVLFEQLQVESLVTGPDAALGQGAEGKADFLAEYFRRTGKRYIVVPSLTDQDGQKISSRKIRQLIVDGEVSEANRLLGRGYAIQGRVFRGDGRGIKMGFPTANLIHRRQVLPRDGVYASRCYLGDEVFPAVTNVGRRPTFGGTKRIIETHLIDLEGKSLYGKRISVEFVERIRDEEKFERVEDLKNQIKLDVQQSLAILEREIICKSVNG